MKKYRQRIVDTILARKLDSMGAVLVEGPKWCGKTTTCKQFAKSILDLSDPDVRDRAIELAEIDIKTLLDGETPRLIDEWQDVPRFWDAIRNRVDHLDGSGYFLLTGSAVVREKKRKQISHSGTGRISRMRMRPMSLWESGESSGVVSISDLFGGGSFVSGMSKSHSLEEMAYIVCRGGWPKAVERGGDAALDYASEYVDAVAESDLSRVDDVPRSPERIRRLLRSLSRLQATQTSLSTIRKDMAANDESTLSELTISSYINALEKIFVVENIHAWSPNLRAKSTVRTSDTRYFVDPSIAAASLGAGPGTLMDDLATFGLFFETMAIRDLRVYAESAGGYVEHYHDKTGLECDAVIHLRNGDFGLVEVKLGGETLIEEGVRTLNRLSALTGAKLKRQPKFQMILCAVGDYAYVRKDGILISPIGALKD
ncbi:MAG: ATP-binding protein [Kiritimatiellae bacterium]|nr:ATP-binding protein [Kiritimatiellia bacterium]